MSVGGRLILRALEVLPEKDLSRIVRRAASGGASKAAIRAFARRYGVAVEEAEKPLEAYPSLLEFFTRRLRPGIRPLDPDPRALLSPADGRLDVLGRIAEGKLIQAKGRSYTVGALLADPELARRYEGGCFATFYLSPRDYHRVHSPATGEVTAATYVPGCLLPVNANAVAYVDDLFARNERLITALDTEAFGLLQVVMVGATCVGHITTSYDPELVTNVGGRELTQKRYPPGRRLERGGELGVFELGSTVVVLAEPGVELTAEAGPIQVGRAFGRSTR
jgi:phosphatidylserine decarboxylase